MRMSGPWDVHPELTLERLLFIAGLIRDIRDEALLEHNSDRGETLWSLGTRVYERLKFLIGQAAAQHVWLTVVQSEPHFVFAIGGVPFRIYRGTPDEQRERWLRRGAPEIQQQVMAFVYKESAGWLWRVLVETDNEGRALEIAFVEMSEDGHVRHNWAAPLSEAIPVLASVTAARADAVELAPPDVGLPELDDDKADEEDSGPTFN